MGTLAINIDMPPGGEPETSGSGAPPTEAQARQTFLDSVSPYLTALFALLPKGSQVRVAGFFTAVDNATETSATETMATAAQAKAAAPAAPAPAPAPAPVPVPAKSATGLGAVRVWLISTAERALFTFLFSFLSALSLSGTFNISATGVALFAGASTALSVVTAAIRSISPPTDSKGLDIVTRTGLTLLQTFSAAFVTSTAGATHFSDWRAGALAGVAAALTTAKGLAAVTMNGTGTNRATPASMFPLTMAKPAAPALSPATPLCVLRWHGQGPLLVIKLALQGAQDL
jgi:hypothetical protein